MVSNFVSLTSRCKGIVNSSVQRRCGGAIIGTGPILCEVGDFGCVLVSSCLRVLLQCPSRLPVIEPTVLESSCVAEGAVEHDDDILFMCVSLL